MFWLLLGFFIVVVAVDAFISAAVIFHLYQYTMMDWTMGRTIAIVYVALASVFVILAITFFLRIPFTTYEPALWDMVPNIRDPL